MNTRRYPAIWLLALLAGLAAACNPFGTPPTATPVPSATPAPKAPTAAPSAAPAATPTAPAGAPPGDTSTLSAWLSAAWNARRDPAGVQAALLAAGWQKDAQDFKNADLDGDGRDEWLVTIYSRDPAPDPAGTTGRFWIVNGSGLAYEYNAEKDRYFTAPRLKFLTDVTGDKLPDAVTEMNGCGASTCFSNYLVLSAQRGATDGGAGPVIRNIVVLPGAPREPAADGISMAAVSKAELSASAPAALVLTGGILGSAGAGITRERTETWGWDGSAFALKDTVWAASDYRHHVLYDANMAFDKNDEQTAMAAYIRVVRDDALKDAPGNQSGESSKPAARQFAAFRLVLLNAKGLAEVEANTWNDWLQSNYPGTALARASATLLREWAASGNLTTACAAVTRQLAGEQHPTGALEDMGYGNPSLKAEDVCPVK